MVTLPYGEGTVEVEFPGCEVDIAEPPGGNPVDPQAAAKAAIADPHGPPLPERVDPDDTVAVVVTDVTRATPEDVLLDVLLTELHYAGIDREQVTIVVGLGLHRPMTEDEFEEALDQHADLAINHDPAATVEVGRVDGVPVCLHRAVASADRVFSTGMVEPHQYAGFSGGAKTVAIGAGGEPFIRYTHGPEMLEKEGVRLGRVADNPFRDTVDRAGDRVALDFCLNVTHGPAGILGASAGDPRAVVRDLAARARAALAVVVDDGYDAVVAGVGAPKDANLYQTTRAATYVVFGARNPLGPGGRVVIPAKLPEGAGEGTGERRFYDQLSEAESAEDLYEAMREGYEPGAQRAFMVARALRNHDVYVSGSHTPDVVEECLMHATATVEEAVRQGTTNRVLVVPDALNTLLVAPDDRR